MAAYAGQYLGTKTAATGVNVVAANDMGFLNVGAYEMAGNDAVGGANNLDLTYFRLAGTMDIAGFDTGFGIQNFGGNSIVTGGGGGVTKSPRATIVDLQMQGDVGTMPLGIYATYGTASASTATASNPFNSNLSSAGGKSKTSFNVAAELGIIPHVVTVQAAIRMAKNGAAVNNGDNAVMLGITYDLAQNVGLSFHHTQQSGSAWSADPVTGIEPAGKDANTLLLEAVF